MREEAIVALFALRRTCVVARVVIVIVLVVLSGVGMVQA